MASNALRTGAPLAVASLTCLASDVFMVGCRPYSTTGTRPSMGIQQHPEKVRILTESVKRALPESGIAAMPPELPEKDIATRLLHLKEACKDGLHEEYHAAVLPFLRSTFASTGMPEATRHFKVFDPENTGFITRENVEKAMHASFGMTPFEAKLFAFALFVGKMGAWNKVPLTEVRKRAGHPSGTRNWDAAGKLVESNYALNEAFLGNPTDPTHPGKPWSLTRAHALIEKNSQKDLGESPSLVTRFTVAAGKKIANGEMNLFFKLAGIKDGDDTVISKDVYRANAEGFGLFLLLPPKDLAALLAGWRQTGTSLRVASSSESLTP